MSESISIPRWLGLASIVCLLLAVVIAALFAGTWSGLLIALLTVPAMTLALVSITAQAEVETQDLATQEIDESLGDDLPQALIKQLSATEVKKHAIRWRGERNSARTLLVQSRKRCARLEAELVSARAACKRLKKDPDHA